MNIIAYRRNGTYSEPYTHARTARTRGATWSPRTTGKIFIASYNCHLCTLFRENVKDAQEILKLAEVEVVLVHLEIQ